MAKKRASPPKHTILTPGDLAAHHREMVFHEAQQKRKLPIRIHGEPEYLENFNDSDHGYLRVTVTRKKIALDYVAVPDPSENARDAFLKPYDTVEVAL